MRDTSAGLGCLTFDLGNGHGQLLGLIRLPLMLLLQRLQCRVGLLEALLLVEKFKLELLRSVASCRPELCPRLKQLGRVRFLSLARCAALPQLSGLHLEGVDADHQLIPGKFRGTEGSLPPGCRIVIPSLSNVVCMITFSISSIGGFALGLRATALGEALPLLPG